ncbi:phytanoyl-CoA dioxygenase family protein [Novosphingobium resinovorum]|uniref:phytanoyl-CoA dioxygenase family protein n=1 Tax=Novosphingobium resinovorum TaxID=158500 RepID=UPI002ED57C78|nr:phytanoyl-CoA dioxygenase family protein [Novosphingobium resinovorum]
MIDYTTRGPVRVVETDWSALDLARQDEHLAVEGYVVVPGLISPVEIDTVRAELADLPMNVAPYSEHQKFAKEPPQWHSPAFAGMIGNPRLTPLLEKALGKDVVFMLGHYITSGPGVPGLALHSDYQPYGSEAKGWEESSPATLRVLIYLDDLTLDKAPFTIVPRSHLAIHEVANPYVRYNHHADMKTITLKAGDAIVFNVKAFHGTHPHLGDEGRGMLEFAYRPLWARCAGPVKEWTDEQLAKAPDSARRFLAPRNAGRAEDMLGQTLDAREGDFSGLMPSTAA